MHNITVSTNKAQVRCHLKGGGFETKWEGRRTFVGDFCVHAVRSGPVFTTERDALAWAQSQRTDEEVRLAGSSQELIASPTVKATRKRPKRRAKK